MTWRAIGSRLRSRQVVLPSLILLVALALRVGWPRLTEFKFSEARLEALVLEITTKGRLPLVGVPSSAGFDHSPISVYLYLPPFILTTNPVPATIYGGLINVVAVWLAWRLARRWPAGGRVAALTTIMLLSVSPWAVLFSRKIWQVAFVPGLALACVGSLTSALVGGRQWALAWGLALYALLVQVHPSAVSLAPALALWLLIFFRQVRLRPLVVGMALGALSAAPFLVHQVRSGWPLVGALQRLPPARWDLNGIYRAWETITGLGIEALAGQSHQSLEWVPQLSRGSSLLGWLVIMAALIVARRTAAWWRADEQPKRQAARVDLILLSWLIIPVLFNLRHSMELFLHFFSLLLPPAFLIVGRAAQAFFSWTHARLLRALAAAALVLVAAAQVAALILMGRFVSAHPTAGGFGTPLGIYLDVTSEVTKLASREQAGEVLAVGPGDSPVVSEYPAIIDVLLRDQLKVRFVDGGSTALFPQQKALILVAPEAGDAADWYQSWPAQDILAGYKTVLLDGTWPLSGFDPVTGPRLFENGIEIQGLRSQPAVAEGVYRIWMQWQVLWLSDADTHFFVQLVSEDGEVWGQDDRVGYPVLSRTRGDRIVSLFDIKVSQGSQGGPTRVRVGQYVFPAIVNVPVIDQGGSTVADFVVAILLEEAP